MVRLQTYHCSLWSMRQQQRTYEAIEKALSDWPTAIAGHCSSITSCNETEGMVNIFVSGGARGFWIETCVSISLYSLPVCITPVVVWLPWTFQIQVLEWQFEREKIQFLFYLFINSQKKLLLKHTTLAFG